MNELTRYTFPMEAKAAATGVLEGYASTFGGPPDLHGDIVAPGAFSESLAEHKAVGTLPALLWGHDQGAPVGKLLDVSEDDHGLFVRGKLTLTVNKAREAYELAQDGALAFSIGFTPVRKSRQNGANVLEAVRLGEVSLVGMAANPRARITAVKSLAGVSTIRDYEQTLRDTFGLSAREAKKLSTGGWKSFHGPDAELAELAEAIRNSALKHFGA